MPNLICDEEWTEEEALEYSREFQRNVDELWEDAHNSKRTMYFMPEYPELFEKPCQQTNKFWQPAFSNELVKCPTCGYLFFLEKIKSSPNHYLHCGHCGDGILKLPRYLK